MGMKLLVGTVLGFLTGLGVGGGSLLILWLTMVLGTDQLTARGINLLFFLPAALIACIFRWKEGTLDLRKILPAILSGAAAAGFFSWVSESLHIQFLRKAFAILLLSTGFRELRYKSSKK